MDCRTVFVDCAATEPSKAANAAARRAAIAAWGREVDRAKTSSASEVRTKILQRRIVARLYKRVTVWKKEGRMDETAYEPYDKDYKPLFW